MGTRSWEELQYFIQNPPQGSKVWAAIQDDEEMAEAILKMTNGEMPKPGPAPLEGWTPERADMATLIDWASVQATQGGKSFKPYPRPVTAIERVRERRKNKKLSALSAKITGKS